MADNALGGSEMERSTEETEAIVRRVCDFVRVAAEKGMAIRPEQQAIYDVDHLVMEANSGASFEQYFRWASIDEIRRVVGALRTVGLADIASLTEQAISLAFPGGIPASEEAKSEADWTEEQLGMLGEKLFPQLEQQNGRITNVLAAYATRVGASA